MNKFCRSFINLRHIRPLQIQLGSRPVHVQQQYLKSHQPFLALNRDPVYPIFSAFSSIAARPYFRERQSQQRDRKTFPSKFDKQNQKLDEEEYGDAVPVESVGHEVSFAAASTKPGKNGFEEFNLPQELIERMNSLGYTTPFEIQAATLNHTLAGKDVVGRAFTGSGKTLAFAIPIIVRVLNSKNRTKPTPKCLVLAPTRELCLQLYKSINELAPYLRCASILGGLDFNKQIDILRSGVDIVIATPGRLRDLMTRQNFIPDDIELVCLDEADEMLTPSFFGQIKDVIDATKKDRQMLMFSATLNKSVAELMDQHMKNPIMVDLTKGKTQKLPANIEHFLHRAPQRHHSKLAGECIKKFSSQRCIIFVNRKILASQVCYDLKRMGIRASELHSNLGQTKRGYILDNFRQGRANVVVATDVASRGLDVPEIDLVIQLEAPPSGVDYYIHRSGRTGRAGRVGRSVMIHSGTADVFSKELSRLVKFKNIDLPAIENTFESDRRQFNDRQYDSTRPRSRFETPNRFNERPNNNRFNQRPNNNRFNRSDNEDDEDIDMDKRMNVRRQQESREPGNWNRPAADRNEFRPRSGSNYSKQDDDDDDIFGDNDKPSSNKSFGEQRKDYGSSRKDSYRKRRDDDDF